jgi:hypothetical protein
MKLSCARLFISIILTLFFIPVLNSQAKDRIRNWSENISEEQYLKSVQDCDELINSSDDYRIAEGYEHLGSLKLRRKDLTGALSDFSKAIRYGRREAFFSRAIVKLYMNQASEARRDWLKADSAIASNNSWPNPYSKEMCHEFMIESCKSSSIHLSNPSADEILKDRIHSDLFLDLARNTVYMKNDTQKSLELYHPGGHYQTFIAKDDSILYKTLKSYNFYQAYVQYLCLYPDGTYVEDIKKRLDHLVLQKADIQLDFPGAVVLARNSPWSNVPYPYWPLDIFYNETGKQIGGFIRYSIRVYDKNGGEYSRRGGDSKSVFYIGPGEKYNNEYWLSGEQFINGKVIFRFEILDCAGNYKVVEKQVVLNVKE